MKNIRLALFILIFITVAISCTKQPGLGGNSTIYGKIIAYDYNSEFTELKGIYPAEDQDVFLIFGNDISYSERIRSNFDGVYEFKYLRPGDYTVYVYSKDSTLTMPSEIYAVLRKVTIDQNKQTVVVDDIKIFR